MSRHYFLRVLKLALLVVPLLVLFVAVIGFVVMSLWNWLMPALFGWKLISYWQALGLIILSRILFGGFRGAVGRGGHRRHRMMERCEKMTPEERERFRQGLHGRWGRVEPRVEPPDSKPNE
jgi:uncharacterized membrane protein